MLRLAYLVSHPIQYQSPLLRRLAREPDIDLTVFFGSDLSTRAYRDEGFGVDVAWDTPLLESFRSHFLPALRDTGHISPTSPISRSILRNLQLPNGAPAFDALWVHGYASVNALHGILAANALGIPVLLRAESWLADRPRGALKLAAKRAFFAALRHAVAATLPIGTHNAAYWRHHLGLTIPQFLVPYAVDNAWFAARAAAAIPTLAALRQELRLTPGRPVILFASKLQPRKNAADLLAAFRRLPALLPPDRRPYLLIAGDGEARAALEAAALDQQQDLPQDLQDIRFLGFQNQTALPRLFALADVFVLPSRHEPWGLIVNEALAAGTPVIVSSDVGCHPDLIRHGVNGFVFPTGDIDALTRCLRDLLAAPAVARRMGVAAQQHLASWDFGADIRGLRAALAHTTRKLRA